jgi:hypothetical protein
LIKFDNFGYTIPNNFVSANSYSNSLLTVKHRASLVDDFAFNSAVVMTSYIEYQAANTNFKAHQDNIAITNFEFYGTINFGGTTGLDSVFPNISGQTINVTAKAMHQTSNAGGLEGDLADLAANNTVNFTWI